MMGNGGVPKMARSQFESITHNNGPDDPLMFNEMPSIGDPAFKARHQVLQGASGNPQRRFKNNQQLNNDLNQSVDGQQNAGKQRNELMRQNSTSRDKSAPTRAPITDIRKKQSSTINVDDAPTPKLNDNARHGGMGQLHGGQKLGP